MTDEASVRYPTDQRERAKAEQRGLACIDVRHADGRRVTVSLILDDADAGFIAAFAVQAMLDHENGTLGKTPPPDPALAALLADVEKAVLPLPAHLYVHTDRFVCGTDPRGHVAEFEKGSFADAFVILATAWPMFVPVLRAAVKGAKP